MVQAYHTTNPWDGVAKGYDLGNALRTDAARQRAGAAIAGGDLTGGANALLTSGDLAGGFRVQDYGRQQEQQAAASKKALEEEGLKFAAEQAARLAEVRRAGGDVLGAFEQIAPQFARYDSPEEVAALRQRLQQDPDTTLTMLGAGAAKQLGYEIQGSGEEVLVIDKATGRLVQRYRGARTTKLGEGEELLELPGTGGAGPAGEAGETSPGMVAPASAPAASPDIEAVWQAAIQQESGGRGDAVGPQTRYGQALGSTQMLPATAEAMARKLGLPWNPALMREASPRALEYQNKLGRAYFEEGLERYGGDPEKALAYYHGGPNEELWGPKTRKHVEDVMRRVQPYEVADARDTPQGPPGARVIASRPKAPKPTSRPATAEEKRQYGLDPSLPAQVKPDGTFDVIEVPKGQTPDDLAKTRRGVEDQIYKAQEIIKIAKEARQNVGNFTAGFVGGNMSEIKGTPAYNLARQIDTIKANLGFAELAAMRASSPTGGALGAVSERELRALESTVSSLDSGQSPDQLKASLDRVEQHYSRWLNSVQQAEGGAKDGGGALQAAKAAIARGAPRAAVIQRLRENGIDPAGL